MEYVSDLSIYLIEYINNNRIWFQKQDTIFFYIIITQINLQQFFSDFKYRPNSLIYITLIHKNYQL